MTKYGHLHIDHLFTAILYEIYKTCYFFRDIPVMILSPGILLIIPSQN